MTYRIKVGWDDVVQWLSLPFDYLMLSPWERALVPVGQLRPYMPREFKGLPDWAILRMTQFPGFAAMTDTTATGAGARVKAVYFKTSGSTFTVPADWQDSFNTVECIGGGGTGASGGSGGDASSGGGTAGYGGRGGGAGGGGAYAILNNLDLTPSASVSISLAAGYLVFK
jgi:uncharacterized membrane protein YgcG